MPKRQQKNPQSSFNQPKTLSGIETAKALCCPSACSGASTNPKPFQGLKHRFSSLLLIVWLASTNPKPFQGLKQGERAEIVRKIASFNQPKTLSGIETGSDTPSASLRPGFNQPKTLSGIETIKMETLILTMF